MIYIPLEDNGAVQVEEATEVPLKVFLAGPIKHWWGTEPDGTRTWDTPERKIYMEWRDQVRLAIVATGFCAVYSPHRAIQGSWHPDLQLINNVAIRTSDVMVILTPPGVPADGTDEEMALALQHNVNIWRCPPGTEDSLLNLRDWLMEKHYLR
jgi:hypothetical protein